MGGIAKIFRKGDNVRRKNTFKIAMVLIKQLKKDKKEFSLIERNDCGRCELGKVCKSKPINRGGCYEIKWSNK